MRRQNAPSNIQHSKHHDSVETIPSSNNIDSAMYERDKQIYKCSTMRQGGKFDPKYKPSILNCPLPEIPKEAESPKKENFKEHNTSYSKTLQRPPMKLPPHGKAIPPPKIESPISPPQALIPPNSQQVGEKNSISIQGGTNLQVKSLSPPVQSPKNHDTDENIQQRQQQEQLQQQQQEQQQQSQSIQEQSAINPNDESNYAVTEL